MRNFIKISAEEIKPGNVIVNLGVVKNIFENSNNELEIWCLGRISQTIIFKKKELLYIYPVASAKYINQTIS